MAFITDTRIGAHRPSIFQKTASAIMHFMVETSEGNLRLRAVRELQTKSDRELADIGIPRQDIVARVFRDRISA